MKRTTLALLAGVLAIGGLVSTATASSAASIPNIGGSVSVRVNDVHFGRSGDCVETPVTVSIQIPNGDWTYYEWEFEGTYDGPTSWPTDVYDSGTGSGVSHDTFTICPSFDRPGSYLGHIKATFYDSDYNQVASAEAGDWFRVYGYHSSSISASRAKYGRHGWALKPTARYDGRAWRNKTVSLQRYAGHGHWTTLRNARTDRNGHATLSVVPANRTPRGYRVLLPAGPSTSAHTTSTHWLKRR